jgi:di/tricarboxylate transporter
LVNRVIQNIDSVSIQIGVLTGAVAFLSAVVKNVGTLGIFLPIAVQVARRSRRSPSLYLMPLAFASLIGGTITLIGTSPNLLISSVRSDLGGSPFRLFDFAYVGLPLTVLTIAYLSLAWRLLPSDRRGEPTAEERFSIDTYATELVIDGGSPFVGKTVGDLEKLHPEFVVLSLMREGGELSIPSQHWPIRAGDVVRVQADPASIQTLLESAKIGLKHAAELPKLETTPDELATIESIVIAGSPVIGETPQSLRLRQHYDINVLAVSSAGKGRATKLQSHSFQVGDVVVLQGWEKNLRVILPDLGLLPLADRKLTLGKPSRGLISLAVLGACMLLIALQVVPVAIGFFAAAVTVIVLGQVSLKVAYGSIEGPVIVLLAALIPIAQSLQTTGVSELIAARLATVGALMPGYAALAMMLAAAMALTPFLNNAAAALMLGPVAGIVAQSLGYNADPFLMAVALGCACDFLTPIGHQNNLLVMAPGGYRFGDYWRLGLPLSLLVLLAGTPLIMCFWPLN